MMLNKLAIIFFVGAMLFLGSAVVITVKFPNVLNTSYGSYVVVQEPLKMISETILWDMVNDWKMDQDGYTYSERKDLCDLASERVNDIKTDFSHDAFVWKNDKLPYDIMGENLSKGFDSERVIFNGWLNSPSHRENLDYPYPYSCIRCDNNYCVQLFAQ